MTERTPKAVIYCCSPRPQGNSDDAGDFLVQGIEEAGGEAEIVYLREYAIRTCIGCYRCLKDPRMQCFQEEIDDTPFLFRFLFEAPVVFFSSPIFFYHLPAHAKAFVDRGQSYFLRKLKREPVVSGLPPRKAYVSLVAGTKGEKLFEGSLLTLKYFLDIFNITLEESRSFRKVDRPGDLKKHPRARPGLLEMGSNGWKSRTP